jgi:hypothetical protein
VKEMAENVWIMLAVRLRSAVSGISQHLVRGQEEAEFFSKKIVLLQKFVIQPKRYRRTCTHPINARGLLSKNVTNFTETKFENDTCPSLTLSFLLLQVLQT